ICLVGRLFKVRDQSADTILMRSLQLHRISTFDSLGAKAIVSREEADSTAKFFEGLPRKAVAGWELEILQVGNVVMLGRRYHVVDEIELDACYDVAVVLPLNRIHQ